MANQKMTEISMSAEKIKEALASKVADKEYKDLYEDIKAHPENYDKNTTGFYVESYDQQKLFLYPMRQTWRNCMSITADRVCEEYCYEIGRFYEEFHGRYGKDS